ncbi:hypothetical protein CTI12_AA398040 [Artemisia annua]|uniref:Replication protein A 70 kDa DNA-binding subunit B/D first OB fold domain-containing protein n=1 Tax=Artemisia annua TaxID=35608 RepID=A0A2U1MBJ6_ARTAN|nr:hypothetical protein CTI12_AA398040 [Artemisia annua]
MSQIPYTQMCDVDPMLDDVTVIARCISTWHSHAKGRPNDPWSLDVVFMDPQVLIYSLLCNRIQATVKKDNMSKFAWLFEEGDCYHIRNFGIRENGGKYPLLLHKYKINFFKNTSLTRIHRFDTNHNGFKFEPFLRFSTSRWAEQEAVGDGKVGGTNDGESVVQFPKEMLIPESDNHVDVVTQQIYPNIMSNLWVPSYFQDRAILAPTHDEVDKVNKHMMSKIDGEERVYYSYDIVSDTDVNFNFDDFNSYVYNIQTRINRLRHHHPLS